MLQANSLAPLGGVFHLAMVLRDALFENQSADNFQQSGSAKYWGTKHLDMFTRKHCDSAKLRWLAAMDYTYMILKRNKKTNLASASRIMAQK